MKQKLLLAGIVLTIILTLMMPTAAYAKSDTGNSSVKTTRFSDSIFVLVTSSGRTITKGNRIITTGEIVQGTFGEITDYPPLSGATLNSTHYSEITLSAPVSGAGTFSGSSINNFKIIPKTGGQLTGVSPTKLSGHYLMIDSVLVVTDVVDQGSFTFSGQIKDKNGFSLVTSTGSASGTLTIVPNPNPPPDFTIGGNATFAGTVKTFSK